MIHQFAISLKIGKPKQPGSPYRVTVRLPDGREAKGTVSFDDLRARTGQDLAKALFQGAVRDLVEEGVNEGYIQILLEIIPYELFPLPWERILEHPPFADPMRFQLIRFSPRLSSLALTPLSLPIDLLIADTGTQYDPNFNFLLTFLPEFEDVFAYFSTTTARVTEPYLRSLLRARPFDIVHLHGKSAWSQDGQGMLQMDGGYDLDAPRLNALLKKSQTRLLILQSYPFDFLNGEPLLDLAHRILARHGPAVFVFAPGDLIGREPDLFQEFYLNLVHDQPLENAIKQAFHPYKGGHLFLPREGQDLLRISPLAETLETKGKVQLEQAQIAREHLLQLGQRSVLESAGDPIPSILSDLEETIFRLENATRTAYDYGHETGGMVPMTEASRTIEETHKAVVQATKHTQRVVNAWFAAGKRALDTKETLAAGKPYTFNVQIGARSQKSHVRGPQAIPEEELQRFYTKKGLRLRVVLFSDDFKIEKADRRLLLPKPPDESKTLTFKLRAPQKTGPARLRACIYYRNNLLQSIRVTARITEEERRDATSGNQGEVEYVLSGSLRHVERFRKRTLNILTNESPNGTHTFAVVGTGLKDHFDLTEGEMRTKIDLARQKLQAICSTLDREGKFNVKKSKYRFEPDNRGKEQDFIADLKPLAHYGFDLYFDLIAQKDWAFDDELRKRLGRSATIQVAGSKSAKYVFPWALVYDKNLVQSDANEVCPTFLQALRQGGRPGFLEQQRCLTQGCPHEDDPNVICPSGFWGFKHVIEQPLSTRQEGATNGQQTSLDLDQEIKVQGQVSLLMAVSETLKGLRDHQQEITTFSQIAADIRSALAEIGRALKRTDLHVVYFFCHGGRTGTKPWLSVGQKEKFFASHLKGWNIRWPDTHPLVFINGCHTADITPDDLLTFNRSLAYCRAAGIIGTEIIIPETLARHFAKGFFEELLKGRKVGQTKQGHNVGDVIRRQRLRLLEHYNPLGLVYTPYCSADLHLIFQ